MVVFPPSFCRGGYLGQKTPTLLVTSDLPRARHQDASSVPVRGLYLWHHWPSAPGPWPPHLSRRSPVPGVEECSSPLSRYPGWRWIVWIPRSVRVPDAECFFKYTATGYYHRASPETTTQPKAGVQADWSGLPSESATSFQMSAQTEPRTSESNKHQQT